jgi:cytochrome c-type biogenesis protein CcmH/NrfG
VALANQVRSRERKGRRLRSEAEALYRRSLAADPRSAEALLRLGRLLLGTPLAPEAEPLLRRAAEEAADAPERYLGLLFLGRAREEQADPQGAATAYRAALEAWPDSQAARLALARCLERSAGPAAAHALVMASLDASRDPGRPRDPWWSYPFGPRGLARAAAERLWQEVLGRPFGS